MSKKVYIHSIMLKRQFFKEVSEMKMVCVCGHMIESTQDEVLHALSHALSYGLPLTEDERALLAA